MKPIQKQRVWIWLAAVCLLCTSVYFLTPTSAQSDWLDSVPLIRLVASPEKYHGKRVRVIGFANLEFEGNVLYLHKEDYHHGILGNGIWINVPSSLNQQAQTNRDRKYCILEGTFDANEKGHMGMWSGSLKNITRFEVWSDPAKPRR